MYDDFFSTGSRRRCFIAPSPHIRVSPGSDPLFDRISFERKESKVVDREHVVRKRS